MENKNVLVALLLMLAVWTGYSMFFLKPGPSQPPVETQDTIVNEKVAAPVVELPEQRSDASVSTIPRNAVKPRDYTVETDAFIAVFSNVGGRLKSFSLKKYTETPARESGYVRLVDPDAKVLNFDTVGTDELSLPADFMYVGPDSETELLVGENDQRELRFSAFLPNGLIVEKVYSFTGVGYDFQANLKILNQGAESYQGKLNFILTDPLPDEKQQSRYTFIGPAVYANQDLETFKVKKLDEDETFGNEADWTIFENKYFMIGVVPIEKAKNSVTIKKTETTIENIVGSQELSIDPGKSISLNYVIYAGPKDSDTLSQVGHDLDKAIDYGMFSIIAKPLLAALNFCHKYIFKNYGVAIILLTVMIKMLFWPLTHKSYKSMRDMQKLQPQMQKIREKYKNDKERMNKEIMELYRNNRVNPMGGCLPMFVQIPVFFALYRVLLDSIALRHEPFIFWIQDLSAKDPYYITPIIMGVTMFIQQKMSPTSMDSQQAKIMLVLPVVFTFMFLNFPSGLVIYWLVNNILTITQQWFINKKPGALPSAA